MSDALLNRQKILSVAFYTLSAAFIMYMGATVFGNNGFFHVQQMQAELKQLKSQNTSIEEENSALHHTVTRLKNDPVYIEHVIREQLQMNAPGEIIFRFDASRFNENQATSPP